MLVETNVSAKPSAWRIMRMLVRFSKVSTWADPRVERQDAFLPIFFQ